jgi:SAM-dependent methyltransferase
VIDKAVRRGRRVARRILGPRFVKHYVGPRRVKGPQQAYEAKEFFESWHKASPEDLSDSWTISAGSSAIVTRFHYNAIENGLLGYFAGSGRRQAGAVLDVGSGAGHWIDFYLDIMSAERVVGAEISAVAVASLARKYADDQRVQVVEADVSAADPGLDGPFDVINAIGVMFHIVDDTLWERAVRNLGGLLARDGVLVVGGQFGRTTQNVQFHSTDSFESWDQLRATKADVALVNKRIRSLHDWKRCARQAGLRVEKVHRTHIPHGILTPENNLLMLRPA